MPVEFSHKWNTHTPGLKSHHRREQEDCEGQRSGRTSMKQGLLTGPLRSWTQSSCFACTVSSQSCSFLEQGGLMNPYPWEAVVTDGFRGTDSLFSSRVWLLVGKTHLQRMTLHPGVYGQHILDSMSNFKKKRTGSKGVGKVEWIWEELERGMERNRWI